jgi:hypothetical protein
MIVEATRVRLVAAVAAATIVIVLPIIIADVVPSRAALARTVQPGRWLSRTHLVGTFLLEVATAVEPLDTFGYTTGFSGVTMSSAALTE